MMPKLKKLARVQLDQNLARLGPLKTLQPPRMGWIRSIRTTLGMTGEQLANRLQTNKQRISRIEHDEVLGRLTLTTLRRVAEALDCRLVYGLVPNQSLEKMVEQHALALAQKRLKRSNQMMRLEKQELSDDAKVSLLKDLVQEIMDEMPKALWDEPHGL